MPLSAGTRLGPYEIVAPIGAGGMGEVYRARDTRLAREVAIKVSAERFSERFEKEAHAIAALNHHNICTLYDVGPNYLVMELVEGPTLADRTAIGKLPLAETLAIARQIADALEAAHEKNIVHRDLKPANIKVKPDGTVKVLDFGLAKTADPTGPASNPENSPTLTLQDATRAGVILGTAGYMSPEQASGKPVDKRADIWAFGVVLWEMLTGRKMFAGETVSHTLAAVLIKDPDWHQLPADTPASLRRLLRRCLERDLKRRLADIGTVRLELEAAAEEKPDPVTEPRPGGTANQLSWAVAGIVTLALAALAFVHFREMPSAAELVRFEISAPANATLGDAVQISPDGRKIAFFATGADRMPMVWVRPLDSREARPLAGTEGVAADTLFWSPDSRFIAFFSGGKLKKIEASGGPAQTLCDAARIQGGFWTPDGRIVFGTTGPLMQVSAAGGAPSPLTVLDRSRQEIEHVANAMLPDGRHFLYLRVSLPLEKGGIYVGSLDAKPDQQSAKRLLPDTSHVVYVPAAEARPASGFVVFARGFTLSSPIPAGTLMAQPFDLQRLELTGDAVPIAEQVFVLGGFSASTAGALVYRVAGAQSNRQLNWFDRAGKVLATPGESGEYNDIALSPDGTQVAYNRGVDLSLFEFARGVTTRFTFGNPAVSPAWSPDGSRLAFLSIRGAGWGVYQKASNGAGQEEMLFESPDPKRGLTWSHDGRFLLYDALSTAGKTQGDLWVLPVVSGSGHKPVAFLSTEFNESFGRFSPDGRWIAYESNQSGKNEIYVLPFDASKPGSAAAGGLRLVSKDGGSQVRWRGDGKELFYVAPDGSIMSVEVNGAGAAFQSETPKPLFKAAPPVTYDVSADGKRFLIAAPPGASAAAPSQPYQVVLNWPAMLKR